MSTKTSNFSKVADYTIDGVEVTPRLTPYREWEEARVQVFFGDLTTKHGETYKRGAIKVQVTGAVSGTKTFKGETAYDQATNWLDRLGVHVRTSLTHG